MALNLQTLPREILDNLGLYLDHASVSSLSCTSKLLHLVYEPFVWRKIVLDFSMSWIYTDNPARENCHAFDRHYDCQVLTPRDSWFFRALECHALSSRIRDAVQELTIYAHGTVNPEQVNITNQRFPNLRVFRLFVGPGKCDSFVKYCRPIAMASEVIDLQLNTVTAFHKLSLSYASKIRSLQLLGQAEVFFNNPASAYIINTWLEKMINLEHLEIRLEGLTIPVFEANSIHQTWLWESCFNSLTKLKSLTVMTQDPFTVFQASYLLPVTESLAISLHEPTTLQVFPHVTNLLFDCHVNYLQESLGIKFPNGLEHLEVNGALSDVAFDSILRHSSKLISLTGAFHRSICETGNLSFLCPKIRNIQLRDVRITEVDDATIAEDFSWATRRRRDPTQHQHFSNSLPENLIGTLRGLSLDSPRRPHGRDSLEPEGMGHETDLDLSQEDSGTLQGDLESLQGDLDGLREEVEALQIQTQDASLDYDELEEIFADDSLLVEQELEGELQNLQETGHHLSSDERSIQTSQSTSSSEGDPVPTVGNDFLGFTALQIISNLSGLRDLETMVVYFPYDFFTKAVYKRLIRQHPKLRAIYLLYRPECVVKGDYSGIFKFVRPLLRQDLASKLPAKKIVYEVDIAGYKNYKVRDRKEEWQRPARPSSVIVDRKCLYCITTGVHRMNEFV